MTVQFPEQDGWPITTEDRADYNKMSNFPAWTQTLAQKLFDTLGAGPPTPGSPPFDTGRIGLIGPFAPNTGWTVVSPSWHRLRDGLNEINLVLRRDGAAVGLGIINLGTFPATINGVSIRPDFNAIGIVRHNNGGFGTAEINATSGSLWTSASGASVATGHFVTFSIHWLAA